ncbi:DEAD/DEAH box helicase [Clostridium perfringens]|uniref:DEAD/DEAH box helicase n=1 Tax=Clostridium perfringens TaxID=1502 RepID=UPI0024BC8FDA|nr:ATP-binding domain-containing protein [Clostridium perfringens]
MVNIIRGPIKKNAVCMRLIEYFENRSDINGNLYLGYPMIASGDENYAVDAMLVSEEHGVVLFDLVEDSEVEDRVDFQDDIINNITSKLMKNKELMKRRKFRVEVSIVTFAPMWTNKEKDELECDLVVNEEELDKFLDEVVWEDNTIYKSLLQAVQAIQTIRNRNKRANVQKENSKGAKLIKLENAIANLDNMQSKAVIETTEGPQRIRGLAGSGKTIILALKVAYLHVNEPDWDICVTFNTRSLKNQFIDLITKFTYEHINDKPNWDKIKIIHAWGNSKDEGVYYNICKAHGVEYCDFTEGRRLANGNFNNAFKEVCKKAISEISEFKKLYDVILVDEAQDFSKEFLNLCYEILPEKKRLIFAYDELQSLNKQSMDTPEKLFGSYEDGKPRVQLKNKEGLPREDIILETCYRNSRPILSMAHALGFGIYRGENELIQMFDESRLWLDIGYEVEEGELEDDKRVVLTRSIKGSPKFLEEHSEIDDIISFEVFNNEEEQAKYVADEIEKNLKNDELQYRDILVVHTDPLTTQSKVGMIRRLLLEKGINNHLAGVSTGLDQFFLEDSITFTSIHRAKGNEAAMVYIIDAQECVSGSELSRKRNILFTAITRSKAWVRITGYGNRASKLKEEFNSVKSHDFKLDFIYPNKEVRKRINVIHRDKTKDEKQIINTDIANLEKLVENISSGKVYKEDLPESLIKVIKEIF